MMNIKAFQIQFNAAIPVRQESIFSKKGIYLCNENNLPMAEASPLPLISKETHEEALLELKKLSNSFSPKKDLFHSYISEFSSVRFALSMYSNESNALLPHSDPKKTYVQGLLTGTPTDVLAKAHILSSKNIKVAKIKVTKATTSAVHETILSIIRDTDINLRIDANQSWKISEAIDFLKDIPHNRIDYLEEPLINPRELELLYSKTNIPYALDENIELFRGKKLNGLKALVIKPTLIGDCSDIRNIMSDYNRANSVIPEIIISSSFESPLGIEYLKKLAQHVNPNGYHGLDTVTLIDRVILE